MNLSVDAQRGIEAGVTHVQKINRLKDAGFVHAHVGAAVRRNG